MTRRTLLRSALLAPVLRGGSAPRLSAALPKLKIRRIRGYLPPAHIDPDVSFLTIVTVETDQGITGIGEGGAPDLLRQVGSLVIGQDASSIERVYQLMWRGDYNPPGKEKLRALSAIDMALWDIKGKALGVPLHDLLGGPTRDYCECYPTSFPTAGLSSLGEAAKAVIALGFRCFRTFVSRRHERFALRGKGEEDTGFDSKALLEETYENCKEIREAVGPGARWCIDYHTRLDPIDAVRLSQMIEPLGPYFAEDLITSEYPGGYRALRPQVHVPIAIGEHYGARWDLSELIENNLIDFCRAFPPNCGGISEYLRIMALCETHGVGLIPHLAGPVSEAAVAHCLFAYPGRALMEIHGRGPTASTFPHLPEHYDFRLGRVWPNSRPGLGVTFDPKGLPLTVEITEARRPSAIFRRPDGSWTNN